MKRSRAVHFSNIKAMSKKQTLFEKRQAMKALRAERLGRGVCQECGERPRTENLDNTKSVHCEPCKQAKQRAAWTALHGPGKRPAKTDEWGMGDDRGYLDTPEFEAYAKQVHAVIYTMMWPPSIADQKRALGDNFVERMHIDALDRLMASGEIRERQSGALTRYEPAVRHERNTVEFGRQYIHGSKGTRKPDTEAFEDRRVTA